MFAPINEQMKIHTKLFVFLNYLLIWIQQEIIMTKDLIDQTEKKSSLMNMINLKDLDRDKTDVSLQLQNSIFQVFECYHFLKLDSTSLLSAPSDS